MGFSLVWGGAGAIVWDDNIPNFPYKSGMLDYLAIPCLMRNVTKYNKYDYSSSRHS